MKLLAKLWFTVAAVGIVLGLGEYASEDQKTVVANPLKANHQQFERIQAPALVIGHRN